MEKHEDNLGKLLKAELEKEAGEIMEEMDSDESLQDISFPEDLDEKMWSKIQEYEEQQEAYEKLSDTDKEAIRLGREIQALRGEDDKDDSFKENAESNRNIDIDNVVSIDRVKREEGGNGDDKEKDTEKSAGKKKVRRKRHWKVYGIVAIVAVLAMMWSMVSIGGTPFFGKLWTQKIGDRKMTQVDTEREDGDKNEVANNDEEQVYEEIKEKIGMDVVRFLPPGFFLQVKDIDTALKRVCLIYENDGIVLQYQMEIQCENKSYGYDVEEKKVKESQIEIDGNIIDITQYELDDGSKKNVAQFSYKDTFYTINATMDSTEFKKILNNLYFF